MDIIKRILAIVVIIISVIFIVVCIAGVVFSWSINTPVTEAITKGLTGVERVLTAADTGLERVNTRLAEAKTAVDTVEQNVETAGDTLSETSVVYEIVDRTVGEELFPKIETARESVSTIIGSVVAFNQTLEAINEIPRIEVPTLTEELETAADRMTSIRNDVGEARSELRAIKVEAVGKPVTAITDRTSRISDGLGTVQSAVTNSRNNIDDSLESLADIKGSVPGVIDLISIVLSFVFLWVGFGQVGLIVLAWDYPKDRGTSEEVEDDKTMMDEEE